MVFLNCYQRIWQYQVIKKFPIMQPTLHNFLKRKVTDSQLEQKSSKIEKKSSPNDSCNKIAQSHLDFIHTLHSSWNNVLKDQFQAPYFQNILKTLARDSTNHITIFPPSELIFNAMKLCPFNQVKVVIIGQDPYHEPGQAEGLCFSVPSNISIPSSLKNIYKEIKNDIPEFKIPKHGHLGKWCNQGILLINTILTVQSHKANSHKNIGWDRFTDYIIHCLNEKQNIVFICWGQQALKKCQYVNQNRHLILSSPHPSGLSAHKKSEKYPYGFFNNHHFTKTNQYLIKHNISPINWQIE